MTQRFNPTRGPAMAVFTVDYDALNQTVHYGCLFHSSARECAIASKLPGFWRVKGGAA